MASYTFIFLFYLIVSWMKDSVDRPKPADRPKR